MTTTTTSSHNVKFTVQYFGNFESEQKLSKWFENKNYTYVHPEEDDDETFNFNYKPEIVKDRYGYSRNYVHIEFETNRNKEFIVNVSIPIIGEMDEDSQLNGEYTTAQIIEDSIKIL